MSGHELAIPDGGVLNFCTFQVEHRLYGISLAEVREVSMSLPITPVPHAPAAVRGLANLRSRIYLVIDLRPILGYAPAQESKDSRLLILRNSIAESSAILVDRGGDVVSAPGRSVESVAAGAAESGPAAEAPPHFVTGICKLEDRLLLVVASTLLVDHVKSLLA